MLVNQQQPMSFIYQIYELLKSMYGDDGLLKCNHERFWIWLHNCKWNLSVITDGG